MADEKDDQQQPPPSTDPALLPLKKRAKYLGISEVEDPVDPFEEEEFKNRKLEELQKEAFVSVIYAFKREGEDRLIHYERYLIIRKLLSEWKIPESIYIYVANMIEKELKEAEEERKKLEESEKKRGLSLACVPKSGLSWREGDAESLIGRFVKVRLSPDEHFDELVIKEYNAKEEKHRLESNDPSAMETDECVTWIDLREISPEDIMWK